MRARRHAVAALALLLGAGLVAGCGEDDPAAGYCDTVAEHRTELSRTIEEGGGAGLLLALPTLADIAEEAPDDIADEWEELVGGLEQLRDALEDAGVEPEAYDPKRPPAGLSTAEQQAIEEAADRVGSQESQLALGAIDQQVRDVCHEPLTL